MILKDLFKYSQDQIKIKKPKNITGVDKIHLNCNCIEGSIVNDIQEPILYSSALEQPPGHEIYEELRIELFKRINKSVLSNVTNYLEDDEHKPFDLEK